MDLVWELNDGNKEYSCSRLPSPMMRKKRRKGRERESAVKLVWAKKIWLIFLSC